MPEEKPGDITHSKREAILDAARTLFTRQGYEETTIPEIARAAGIAVGTVYLYFHNKHEILSGVSLDLEATLTQAFRDSSLLSLPFSEVPHAMVEAVFRVGRQKKAHMSLLQITMQSSEEVLQYKQLNDQLIDAIDGLLQIGIAQGHLAPFDTAMYARLLYSLGRATLHQCYVVEGGEREDLYHQSLTSLVERLFFGPPLSGS